MLEPIFLANRSIFFPETRSTGIGGAKLLRGAEGAAKGSFKCRLISSGLSLEMVICCLFVFEPSVSKSKEFCLLIPPCGAKVLFTTKNCIYLGLSEEEELKPAAFARAPFWMERQSHPRPILIPLRQMHPSLLLRQRGVEVGDEHLWAKESPVAAVLVVESAEGRLGEYAAVVDRAVI